METPASAVITEAAVNESNPNPVQESVTMESSVTNIGPDAAVQTSTPNQVEETSTMLPATSFTGPDAEVQQSTPNPLQETVAMQSTVSTLGPDAEAQQSTPNPAQETINMEQAVKSIGPEEVGQQSTPSPDTTNNMSDHNSNIQQPPAETVTIRRLYQEPVSSQITGRQLSEDTVQVNSEPSALPELYLTETSVLHPNLIKMKQAYLAATTCPEFYTSDTKINKFIDTCKLPDPALKLWKSSLTHARKELNDNAVEKARTSGLTFVMPVDQQIMELAKTKFSDSWKKVGKGKPQPSLPVES